MIFFRRDGFTSPATTEEIIQMSIKGNTPKFDIGKKLKNIHLMILKCCKNFITKILNWC